MFNKLIARFQDKTANHPLGNDANIDNVLADISLGDPERALIDVDDWLVAMKGHASEIGWPLVQHALFRLDQYSIECAGQLLVSYLSENAREFMSEAIWSRLDTHSTELFQCHADVLHMLAHEAKNDADKLRMARSAARAMRAWSSRKKLQRLRYRLPTAALWQSAHDLMRVLARAGLLQIPVEAYRDEASTTPLNEYLMGLYLEFVPVGNLVPQQLEFADRLIRANSSSGGLELNPQPHDATNYLIDVSLGEGPRRFEEFDPTNPNLRYCSTSKLRAPLMKLANQVRRQTDVPAWLTSLPASRSQIETAILTLALHWAPTPPKRMTARINTKNELRVLFGFSLCRRMVAASHFARMGRQFKYDGLDFERLYDEARFGRIQSNIPDPNADVAETVAIATPLEILRRLELAGDKAQMESWIQVDGSDTGLGATVPAIFARHRIGALVGLRHADGLEWQLGIIRRIGRDASNRPNIGIETLGRPSICAQAKPVSTSGDWRAKIDTGHDGWSDAIIVSQEGKELLLPAGSFEAGLQVMTRSEEGSRQLQLQSLLDRGLDYDRIEFIDIN